jgi:hypothetical protein
MLVQKELGGNVLRGNAKVIGRLGLIDCVICRWVHPTEKSEGKVLPHKAKALGGKDTVFTLGLKARSAMLEGKKNSEELLFSYEGMISEGK